MSKPFVMLVDDEVPFVDTMTKRLEKRELIVLTAHDGQEALKALDKHRDIDVVILDVNMPGMGGIETLGEIKKAYPLIEVIMLTGNATIETAIEGMKSGAYDYLMKPCEIDQIMQKVGAAVVRKRDHEEKIRKAQVKKALSSRGMA